MTIHLRELATFEGLLVAAALFGMCAPAHSESKQTHSEYALYFGRDGLPLDRKDVIDAHCIDKDALKVVSWRAITTDCFDNRYVPRIIRGIDASQKKKVIIFIHGGLNGLEDGRDRVDRIVRAGDGEGTVLKDYYPIFINWEASFFSSYVDHVARVRQGLNRPGVARITALPVFLEDGIVGAARVIPDAAALVFNKKERSAALTGNDVREGCDLRTSGAKTWDVLWGVPFVPLKPFTTGFILDAYGSEAWKMMLRHTELMFHREKSRQQQSEITNEALEETIPEPRSLPAFLQVLSHHLQEKGINLDLVAHSAGSIIANQALREVPKLPVDHLVYMASAASVEDYESTVLGDGVHTGFLSMHRHTEVYHLVLHPEAELREFNLEFGAGLAIPRGSLLAWLDDFLTDPKTLRERTAGRATNLAARLEATPHALQGRVHVKMFDFGVPNPIQGNQDLQRWYVWCDSHQALCQPQKHGDFSEMPFWEDWFREPDTLPICTARPNPNSVGRDGAR
jgi:pimeloyl-ACP methyl ester carboxylesterase